MRSCYRSQKRLCSKKEKDISIVKNREKGDTIICEESVEERIYLIIEITTDIISIFCAKKKWKEKGVYEDGFKMEI